MRTFLCAFLFSSLALNAAQTVWLDTLDLSLAKQGWGHAQTNKAIRGTPLSIGGKVFERGLGTHSPGTLYVDLAGGTERFTASVGVDDAADAQGSVAFRVYGDGRKVFDSGLMKKGAAAKPVDLRLTGVRTLLLQVTDGGNGQEYDHANWADTQFTLSEGGAAPRTTAAPAEPKEVLTPPPGPAPRINGPAVYGCRPGNPFLYRIPTQGQRPMKFAAEHLPRSLSLDRESGIISGKAPERGTYEVILTARNTRGTSTRKLRIISGDTLALTPPMGWNHWYAHYDRVTDRTVREAADIMIASGMADVGYSYVNIDDCWMNAPSHQDPVRVGPARDSEGRILSNKYFPDMKTLADYIHGKGLKAGLYTSPGPLTCAGFHAAYGYEQIDARTFAEWGYDFLKYDWCSYGHIAEGGDPKAPNIPHYGKGAPTREAYIYPYKVMGSLLKQQRRDMVFNLCQYGMGNVWEWGESIGGHCWRTAGDLGFELNRVFEVALKNSEHRAWSRPGAWNDPDYIQIGWIGNARGGGLPQPCNMTPSEQYAYMSLWCLMASPLFYSGDMSKLDEFTLNVLCNPEVIDVNQDPLGQQAAVAHLDEEIFVMVKNLEDGSTAVGLFNRSEMARDVTLPWPVAGLIGKQAVRDLWRHQDLGVFERQLTMPVPRHGGVLVKLKAVK